jgi:hypothetical protein
MAQRLALVATAGVAAFVVVVLGALLTYVFLHGTAGTPAFAAQPGATQPDSLQAPAPNFGGQPQGNSQAPQTGGSQQPTGYAISADDAANIALSNAPGASLVQQPRLVNMNGTVAYEVALDRGFVYVDASSGQVLFNGANGQQPRRHRRPGG